MIKSARKARGRPRRFSSASKHWKKSETDRMRKQILKRLEALERAAEKEIFARAPTFSYAIAYFLGDAKHVSDPHAYARALGYQDRAEFCRAFAEVPFAELLSQPSRTL